MPVTRSRAKFKNQSTSFADNNSDDGDGDDEGEEDESSGVNGRQRKKQKSVLDSSDEEHDKNIEKPVMNKKQLRSQGLLQNNDVIESCSSIPDDIPLQNLKDCNRTLRRSQRKRQQVYDSTQCSSQTTGEKLCTASMKSGVNGRQRKKQKSVLDSSDEEHDKNVEKPVMNNEQLKSQDLLQNDDVIESCSSSHCNRTLHRSHKKRQQVYDSSHSEEHECSPQTTGEKLCTPSMKSGVNGRQRKKKKSVLDSSDEEHDKNIEKSEMNKEQLQSQGLLQNDNVIESCSSSPDDIPLQNLKDCNRTLRRSHKKRQQVYDSSHSEEHECSSQTTGEKLYTPSRKSSRLQEKDNDKISKTLPSRKKVLQNIPGNKSRSASKILFLYGAKKITNDFLKW